MSKKVKNNNIVAIQNINALNYNQYSLQQFYREERKGIFKKDDNYYLIIGIDLAETVIQLCYIEQSTNTYRNIAIYRFDFIEFLKKINCNVRFVMESCSNTHVIIHEIQEVFSEKLDLDCQIIAPSATYLNKFARNYKSDAKDADFLFKVGHMEDILTVNIRSTSNFINKELHHYYESTKELKKDLTVSFNAHLRKFQLPELTNKNFFNFKETLKESLQEHLFSCILKVEEAKENLEKSKNYKTIQKNNEQITQSQFGYLQLDMLYESLIDIYDTIYLVSKHITAMEERMEILVKSNEDMSIIASIPGISYPLAVGLAGAIDDISKFKKVSNLMSFLGISPKCIGSGGESIFLGQVEHGDFILKRSLYRALFACFVGKTRNKFYIENDFLKGLSKDPKQKAVFKLMRKTIRLVFTLLKSRTFYDNELAPLGRKKNILNFSTEERRTFLDLIYNRILELHKDSFYLGGNKDKFSEWKSLATSIFEETKAKFKGSNTLKKHLRANVLQYAHDQIMLSNHEYFKNSISVTNDNIKGYVKTVKSYTTFLSSF